MEKVFSNLIGNAVKYSPPKAVINITVRKQAKATIYFP